MRLCGCTVLSLNIYKQQKHRAQTGQHIPTSTTATLYTSIATHSNNNRDLGLHMQLLVGSRLFHIDKYVFVSIWILVHILTTAWMNPPSPAHPVNSLPTSCLQRLFEYRSWHALLALHIVICLSSTFTNNYRYSHHMLLYMRSYPSSFP